MTPAIPFLLGFAPPAAIAAWGWIGWRRTHRTLLRTDLRNAVLRHQRDTIQAKRRQIARWWMDAANAQADAEDYAAALEHDLAKVSAECASEHAIALRHQSWAEHCHGAALAAERDVRRLTAEVERLLAALASGKPGAQLAAMKSATPPAIVSRLDSDPVVRAMRGKVAA